MTTTEDGVVWGSCWCKTRPIPFSPASPSLGKLLVVALSSFSQLSALGEEVLSTWYSQGIWYSSASPARDRTKLCM